LLTVALNLRLLVNKSFSFVIVGQFLAGISHPIFYNSIIRVMTDWFKRKEVSI
jgi:hypothetical protein